MLNCAFPSTWNTFPKHIFFYSIAKSMHTIYLHVCNLNTASASTFPVVLSLANTTLFSYPCWSIVDMNCQVWEKEKIKLTQLSSPHPIPAMSLKRMLCSAVLLHYQQTDNLFDSASREYCDVQYTLPHSPFPISINSFLLSNTVCASFFFFFHLSFQQVQDRRKPLSRQVRAHVHCVKDKKKKIEM